MGSVPGVKVGLLVQVGARALARGGLPPYMEAQKSLKIGPKPLAGPHCHLNMVFWRSATPPPQLMTDTWPDSPFTTFQNIWVFAGEAWGVGVDYAILGVLFSNQGIHLRRRQIGGVLYG